MDFVGHLNDQLEKKNDFSKDFVLRACLVATGLDCAYQIKNFTSANLLLIEQQWQEIKRAVEATVRLVNRFGLDRDTLTGDNALMPIIYYMKRTRHGLRSRTEFELRNAERIRLWLTGALLGSLFTGWADIVLRKSRELVKEALDDSDDFPVERMVRTLSIRGKEEMYTEPFFRDVMSTKYTDRSRIFLCASLIYDLSYVDGAELRVDHIFPRAAFNANSSASRHRDMVWCGLSNAGRM